MSSRPRFRLASSPVSTLGALLALGCAQSLAQSPSRSAAVDGVRILGNFSLECGNQGNGECWVPLIITVGGPNCTVGYVFQTVSTPRNVRIIWYLNLTSGYAFDATNGIAITNNNGAFAGGGHNGGRPYQFHWQSSPVSSAQSRSYDIRVKHEASGNFCSFVDPLIVNRG